MNIRDIEKVEVIDAETNESVIYDLREGKVIEGLEKKLDWLHKDLVKDILRDVKEHHVEILRELEDPLPFKTDDNEIYVKLSDVERLLK